MESLEKNQHYNVFLLYLMKMQIKILLRHFRYQLLYFQWCTKQNYTHIYVCLSLLNTNIPIELMKYVLISELLYIHMTMTYKPFQALSTFYEIWDNKLWLNIYFLWRTITSEIIQNVLTLSARGSSVHVKTPDSNVCRRQIQTSIDGSRAKRTYNCPTPIT